MLPGDGELSSKPVVTGSIDPVKRPGDFLIDYERGGIALNDPSQGLLVQLWKLHVERDKDLTDQWNFYIDSPSNGTQFLFSAPGVKEAALAFDQNMRPFVVYVENTTTKMWWYDPTVPGQIITTLGTDFRSPRCTTDEKRPWHLEVSDIQLWYVRGSQLCVRYQRERFTVEHAKKTVGPQATLVSVTMSTNGRLQLRLRNTNVSMDDQQAKVMVNPLLSDIVGEICEDVGIPREATDINDLYEDEVVGYLVASEDGVAESLKPLSKAFFFDPAEFDRKLRFLKRGRDVSFRFTYADLVDANPNAMKQKRVDETKLPKRVDVNHIDPAGGFAKNKQSAYRKSNLVQATGSETLEFASLVLTADQAATLGLKYMKEKWWELMDYEGALPIAFSFAAPTDVAEYVDRDGSVHRIRMEELNQSDGVIKFKAKLDGGADVYGTQALGLPLPPPLSTTPGLVGETRVEILNLPPLRDQDDELGVYVAMAGSSTAWFGASLEISTDGGVNFVEAFQNEIPATLGDTETELQEEISAEYPSRQTLVVKMNFGLESTDYATLLTNYNRAVIGDEVIQFQNAVHLGDNRYLLSGLIRGRYNTKPEHWAAGTRFVLIDTSLVFLQAQQWMLGKEIQLKAISFGTDGEDSVPVAYDFDVAHSQLEWPPHHLQAVRDGSNNVAVSWIGRGRLGIETAPSNGKYFTGYKVVFSDGFTDQVGSNVYNYTRNAAPAGVTVKVCGTNSITGDGDYSEVINT